MQVHNRSRSHESSGYTKEILYRISQEATHNIVKHARASQVTINLQCSEDRIWLEIFDNGCGFDPTLGFLGHLGLKSMRERATRCQGEVQIDSALAGGQASGLLSRSKGK